MLAAKPKLCNGCDLIKPIWKRQGGQRYCKECWSCHSSNKTTKTVKSQKPLSPKSSKKEKLDVAYSILRKKHLEYHPLCQAKLPGCSLTATDIHHKHGRVGELYLDQSQFISICRTCHTWIHNNPKEAKELNLYH